MEPDAYDLAILIVEKECLACYRFRVSLAIEKVSRKERIANKADEAKYNNFTLVSSPSWPKLKGQRC